MGEYERYMVRWFSNFGTAIAMRNAGLRSKAKIYEDFLILNYPYEDLI